MPIYEYQCKECGHRLEAMQKMSDAPLEDCPECGASALGKLMSASAFRLKGGGWYETDFKGGNQRNVAQSDNKGEKTATSAESKPETRSSTAESKSATKSSTTDSKGKLATGKTKKSSA